MEQKLEFKTDTKILNDIYSFVLSDEFKWPDTDTERTKDKGAHLELLLKNFIDNKTLEIKEKGDFYINSIIKDLEDNMSYTINPYRHKPITPEDTKYTHFVLDMCKNNKISSTNCFRYIVVPSSIMTTLLENLSSEWKEFNESINKHGLLEQQVSPPLSAYEYVPFNKTNITYSDRSYGLLFE